ncbi:glutamate receptor 2.3-like [Sesamum indicum]|uniref:Glutamate receptor n=1 Tax=Sesamum indicum TaxID=4182 RepID=A0A6I9TMI8_SESIN|nr:glutamate receptor 2.3-like [Sesamum indicum]
MAKKPVSHAIFYALFSILSFQIFLMNVGMAQGTKTDISVGVVLDMDIPVSQMSLNCISMALSKFYATHDYYKTRLALSTRDSNGTVVGAAAVALDLLKNVEVQAIIGPLFSMQANFLIELGDKAQVPIITFSATSPSLTSRRSPYFIRATLNDSSQVQPITAIIEAFGWREVVPIYVDNEFGEGVIPYLTDALENVNVRVPYRSVIPLQASDEQIVAELYKLMTMQTRVFVVHMLVPLGFRLFAKAKQLGMITEGYAWIITDSMTDVLNSVDPSVMDSMLGVIGVQSYVPKTDELDAFTNQYKKRLLQNNPPGLRPELNTFGLRAYDSAIALAIAIEKANPTNARFKKANFSGNSTDLEAIGVSNSGPRLIQALSSTAFRGLAGDFQLVEGQLRTPPYQIINVVGPGARVIGYWTKQNGIVKELNVMNANTYSTSRSNFAPIIWPGDTTTPPKGWVIPTNEKKLRVGVPVKDGFNEFLRITGNSDNTTKVEGYCIDVFDAVITSLKYAVPYEYIPFANPDHEGAGNYNDLVYQVYLGNFDAVVGDVTIRANRSQYVDFTLPYTETGVSMVAKVMDNERKNAWIFLKPLTWQLWLTSFCSFVFIGFLIWILERRINTEFSGSIRHQIGMIFWFGFSTMVFSQKEKIISNLARFLLIIWFLVVLILTQSYTASLTSMLTVQQLQPTYTDFTLLIKNKENVGYQKGSFVFGLLKKMSFNESRLVAYNSPDEMHDLFSKGSGNGGIAAAFDETPYIKMFLAKYCSEYTMVDPMYKTAGFGFVFPKGSPLVPDISSAILNVTEGEKMVEIERAWFSDKTTCSSGASSSQSLGLESFRGLFVIVLILGGSAFVVYVVMFVCQNWGVVRNARPNATIGETILMLRELFFTMDPNADPDPIEILKKIHEQLQQVVGRDPNPGNINGGVEREMEIMEAHGNVQQRPPNPEEEPPQPVNPDH